jgi:hypothetical protein
VKDIKLYYVSPWSKSTYAMAHYKADQLILWFTTKRIKLCYGSRWSPSNYTRIMFCYETDQTIF